ncbi:MAG: class I SAM-dependent methyltransferase [Flavobacteriales bacterium]
MEQSQKTNISSCPICKGEKQIPFLICKDYTVSKEDFSIVSCGDCSFRYTQNPPIESEAYRFYQSEDYVSHSSSRKGIINFLYNKVRVKTLRQKVKIVKKYSRGNILVDVGAGTGHFLNEAKNSGLSAEGFEPSKDACLFAKENFNIELRSTEELFNKESNSVDVITLWHVLEHVYPLKEYVKTIRRILKNNGIVIIAVPNCVSYDAEHYQKHWAAYDVPRHLYHFRPESINHLSQLFDLELIDTLPMSYDAYYVSMLSEKHKRGNVLKAIWLGFLSNRKAKRSGMYSSLIYVLQKRK